MFIFSFSIIIMIAFITITVFIYFYFQFPFSSTFFFFFLCVCVCSVNGLHPGGATIPIVKSTQLCSKFTPTAFLNFACDWLALDRDISFGRLISPNV